MSSYDKSTYFDDVIDTRTRTRTRPNVKEESPLHDESSMPLVEIDIGLLPSLKLILGKLDLYEGFEEFSENPEYAHLCVTKYLQALKWRQHEFKSLHENTDFAIDKDTLDDMEYGFEEFPDSEDEDDASDNSDSLEDSIRLTKSRFSKKNRSPRIQSLAMISVECEDRKDANFS